MVDERGGHLGMPSGRVGDRLADLEAVDVVPGRQHHAGTAVPDLAGVIISCQIRRTVWLMPLEKPSA